MLTLVFEGKVDKGGQDMQWGHSGSHELMLRSDLGMQQQSEVNRLPAWQWQRFVNFYLATGSHLQVGMPL